MKTIREWFKECADPKLSKKLFKYAKRHRPSSLNRPVKTLARAIDLGFNWRNTDEGVDYWMEKWVEVKENPDKYASNYYKQKQKLEI